MSNIIEDYKNVLYDEGTSWLDMCYSDYDSWDALEEDMALDITGNNGIPPATCDIEMAEKIVWEDEFLDYCHDMGADMRDLLSRGKHVIDCYARYMVLEYTEVYSNLRTYYESELVSQDE